MTSTKSAKRLAAPLFATCLAMAAISTAALGVSTVSAQAQTPTQIKQNKAWGAFSYQGSDGKVCYVLSIPTEKVPADVDHGDIFFMLAKHPGQNVRLEPQFTAGYNFREESKVELDIDGTKFSMFTRGQNAWLENPAEEATVVAAMKKGRAMKVTAISRRGTNTSYAYSLSGVTASIEDITNCQ